MLFSSPVFIFLFLPISFFVYFLLNKIRMIYAGKIWLVVCSLFFYGYWDVSYLPLLLGSILFNFIAGGAVSPHVKGFRIPISRKSVLTFAIIVNLSLLGYYKYTNFFIENFNALSGYELTFRNIILPLGISFYTFTQTAFLVDSYRGGAEEYDFINYALFVTFFPHLIAGPILHHKEMMTQFQSKWNCAIRHRNIFMGLFIFSVGLFKKVIVADNLAVFADAGFAPGAQHDFFSSWATSLSYTFQLYFDFSGYCDMAIGAALLFNIWLPLNFNSPYKSFDIQDFWRRWHITLGRYLRDYIYIPLGGNRCSSARIYFNLFATFFLGGLWHGASWMFIIWGVLHGGALVIHRWWKRRGLTMPSVMAWFITFMFVNVAWVFFRAHSIDDAMRILHGMLDFSSISSVSVQNAPTDMLAWGGVFTDKLSSFLPVGMVKNFICYSLILLGFLTTPLKNSYEMTISKGCYGIKTMWMVLLFVTAVYATIKSTNAVFLYFNF
ncbi:MBOAT family O-acyltransferase [Citrobacter braakii]|uniref:MBOAT family O-acyltransferase n=1 Tax=Citrobacter braakii TaxID=57706 RepID=UPI00103D172E|nr:MBOAT family O-acyltransferase [Citrobacter braakii]TCC95886.1 MBOAT family protein [Citrobacter braakii]HAT7506342.1 MBOAT family protein [Citrobacter braakii]